MIFDTSDILMNNLNSFRIILYISLDDLKGFFVVQQKVSIYLSTKHCNIPNG